MKSKAGTKAELRAACCPWAAEAAARGFCSDSFSAVKIYVFAAGVSASEGDGLRADPAGVLGRAPMCHCTNLGAGRPRRLLPPFPVKRVVRAARFCQRWMFC